LSTIAALVDKWRSVLKQPERYRLMTATEVVAGVGTSRGRFG
jgi:hypothetical protein